MSKLDAKVFSSITPFAKQWILGDELMYEFLNEYQDFLSDSYGIVDLGSLSWYAGGTTGTEKRMVANGVQNIIKKPSSAGTLADINCTKYEVKTANGTYSKQVGISVDTAGSIIVYDENYNTAEQVADFKAAMQGVYLVFRLADNIKRKSYVFNKDNQANITYFGIYSNLQTFYTNVGDTEYIPLANIYLTSSNSNWIYTGYDEVDHSYRLQHGPEGTENVGRAYVFVSADNEAAAREIINNDPVIVYCYYKN